MHCTFLTRLLLILGAIVLLLAGCAATPVAEDESQFRSADLLYAKAREAYRSGDYYLAAERLIVLARQGDPRGQYALGYLYYRGQGVLGDRARAMELFRMAAAQGNAKARQALALLEGRVAVNAPPAERTGNTVAVVEPPAAPGAHSPATASAEVSEPPAQEATEPVFQASSEPAAVPSAAPEVAATDDSEEPFSVAWLRRQDSSQYTIQLVGGSSRKSLGEFAERNRLAEQSGVVETRLNGERWYVVLFGLFADMTQARAALQGLPVELRRDRPWIRPLRDVLASLPAS